MSLDTQFSSRDEVRLLTRLYARDGSRHAYAPAGDRLYSATIALGRFLALADAERLLAMTVATAPRRQPMFTAASKHAIFA